MPNQAVQYIERHIHSNDWVTLFLVGCIILFSIVKYAYPRRFQDFIMLPFNSKYLLVHDKNDEIKHPFNIVLFVTQVISISLFIYLFLKIKDPDSVKTKPWLFAQICTAYSIFILIKFSIEKIVGSIFSIEGVVNSYLYQKLSYRNLLAMVVFIGNLIFFYIFQPSISTLLIYSLTIVLLNCLALFYSYKLIGNLILGNISYFILYLCALEISPYVILYKVMQ